MRASSNSWPASDTARNFRFFAEVMQELVDDQTWEANRCDSLSFKSRLQEFLTTLEMVQRKEIPKPTLTPLLDEINHEIRTDPIVSINLSNETFNHESFFLRYSDSTESLKRRTQLVMSLVATKYRNLCEDEIKKFCTGTGKEKDHLVRVAKCYASDLISSGCDRRHVFTLTKDFFFGKDIRRCTKGLLDRYFAALSKQGRKYSVFVTASKPFSKFVANHFPFKQIERSVDIEFAEVRRRVSNVFASRNALFIKVSALDPYSAVRLCEKMLSLAMVFGSMRPERLLIRLGTNFYVIDDKEKLVTITRPVGPDSRLPPTLKQRRFDADADFASYMFNSGDEGTFNRLYRSAVAASQSLTSPDTDVKIVSLWSAFEVLLPPPTKDVESTIRIIHFCELLVPCILFDYLRVVFEVTYRNFRTVFGDDFSEYISKHGNGTTKAEKLASLVLGKNPSQQGLLNLIAVSPLATYRLGRLQRSYSDPKNIVQKIDGLQKKLEWQLHRIYRERNNIVHSGRSSAAGESLLEHAYSYYQFVLFLIEDVYRKTKIADSDQAIEFVNIAQARRREKLIGFGASKELDQNERAKRAVKILFSGL